MSDQDHREGDLEIDADGDILEEVLARAQPRGEGPVERQSNFRRLTKEQENDAVAADRDDELVEQRPVRVWTVPLIPDDEVGDGGEEKNCKNGNCNCDRF